MSSLLQEVPVKYAVLAALLLTVPAAAQNRAAELVKSAQSRAAVGRAIAAMRDGASTGSVAGPAVVDFLQDNDISVAVRTQTEASTLADENGQTMILLSDSVPATPRVYGALIAKEAAALMYADMPVCSERSYMRRATVARVWIELGGKLSKLPIVEPLTGATVAAVSDEISLWADKNGAEMALYKIGEAERLSILPVLAYAVKGDAARAKLDAANVRFVSFLIDEAPFRQAVGLR